MKMTEIVLGSTSGLPSLAGDSFPSRVRADPQPAGSGQVSAIVRQGSGQPRVLRLKLIPGIGFEPIQWDRLPGEPPCHPAVTTYLAPKADSSARTLLQALDAVAGAMSQGCAQAENFPWHELRYAHTKVLQGRLRKDYSIAGANKIRAAVRGVLREAWQLELISTDDYQRAIAFPAVRGTAATKGRALESAELVALMERCEGEGSVRGIRDAAAISLGYDAGLRVHELLALDVEDLALRRGKVRLRKTKGNKAAQIGLLPETMARLEAWLAERGSEPGPLWVSLRKGGRLDRHTSTSLTSTGDPAALVGGLRRLTERGFGKMLAERLLSLGFDPASPHDLRRSMITHLLDRTGDVGVAQRRARHASAATTLRYDRRTSEQDTVQAARALSQTFR